MLAATTRLLVGQRLIKRLCPHCRRPHRKSEALVNRYSQVVGHVHTAEMSAVGIFFEAGGGCSACNRSGYSGRSGIFELREIQGAVADLLLRQRPRFDPRAAEAMFSKAVSGGDVASRSMREDGMLKAALGLTTPEEVFGATMEEP